MHLEIQVALNFVISYMYNKLPRRRVNIFGEELERALEEKFEGHWYPEKPMKGSAYRCLKTGDPVDQVLLKAAREAGIEIHEIKENLPEDLAVWVDPGEVSYRIGEKSQIKVLYSEVSESLAHEESLDKEVTKTFNPEAQCFKPIEDISSALSSVSISPKSTSPLTANSPTPPFKQRESSPVNGFIPKSAAPLTFTTASFAQTKFGSTKLKTNTKRVKMSPTEFSHYIKQRQLIQQQQTVNMNVFGGQFPLNRPRSLSPNLPLDHSLYFSSTTGNSSTSGSMGGPASSYNNPWSRNIFDQSYSSGSPNCFADLLPPSSQPQAAKFPVYEPLSGSLFSSSATGGPSISSAEKSSTGLNDAVMGMYPTSHYQHLLVAN